MARLKGRELDEQIARLVEPMLTIEGYELVDVEVVGSGPRTILRLFIDKQGGVSIDDCASVSEAVDAILDVEDPFESAYTLEVSSPGLDRPLRKPSDWSRFIGHEVDVTFRLPFEGRRKFRGLLTQAEPSPRLVVRLGPADQALDFTLDEVREARLVPVVDFKGRGKGARNGEQEP